jgi:hypothetical protein
MEPAPGLLGLKANPYLYYLLSDVGVDKIIRCCKTKQHCVTLEVFDPSKADPAKNYDKTLIVLTF